MKKLKALLAVLLFSGLRTLAQPTDLFISEYVEGSSFNKAIELYNGTNAPIDLAAGQYVLETYFNGSVSGVSVALTGTVPAGGVFILAHPSATLGIAPDMTTTVVNFNGDDAVVLRKNSPATVLDVIGQVGFDPGTQWGLNDTCTLDRTIRRKLTVCQGDPTLSNPFYTAPEWDGFPQNTFAGLGSHTVSCGASNAGLSVLPLALNFNSAPGVPSAPQSYAVSGTSLTLPVDIIAPALFEVSLLMAGPFTSSLSVPAASFVSGPVTVYARFVPVVTGTATGQATHSSGSYSANAVFSGTAAGLIPIAQIQGSAAASPYVNQVVTTQGVVTADFQAANELGGFFIQDPVGDNDPQTSEGIFVNNTSFAVNAGDMVIVSGTVQEYFNKTRLNTVTSVSIQSSGGTVTPVGVTLPFATMTDAERWEGMRVVLNQTLTVTEVYTLARYGEVALSVNGRLMNPTNFVDPNDQPASGTSTTGTSNVAAVLNQQLTNNLSRILLDDKSNVQNPPVVPYVDPVNNTLRCGSTISGLSGVMDFDFSVYRIQPVGTPVFNYAARPAVPSVGNADVKIGSFNVLNYFNGNGSGGGFPTSRGANTAVEFTRQRDKIIEAIKQLDADAIGLMEMENDGNGPQSAIQDLVNGLNTVTAPGTYTFIADPTAANGGTGTDEIKVALLYKPGKVTPVGLSKADNSAVHNRPPLAQTFSVNSSSEKFSVIVNHFKSKGCTGATGNNSDQNDGQSCFNASRRDQAVALLNFVNTIKTDAGDNDVLLIGDFNAYEQEDPIDVILGGGFSNLLPNAYSYVFDGQSGSLDHALASDSVLAQITGAAKWHINADEPIGKDYNQEFNPPYLYEAGPYRSSDHDPVLIGLAKQTSTTTTAIHDIKTNAMAFSLFPNPLVGQRLEISFQTPVTAKTELYVYDQLGNKVFATDLRIKEAASQAVVELPDFGKGLYFVELHSGQDKTIQKLLITN